MDLGHALVAAAAVVAAGDWVAVARRSKPGEYVLKPLTTALLLAGAAALGRDAPDARAVLTVAALAFSLAGDVFLMLPQDRLLPGLGAFLAAHLAYVAAFNTAPPPVAPAAVSFLAVGAVTLAVVLRVRRGLLQSGRARLLAPVAAYAAAISLMVASALVTWARPEWPASRSALATAGALLFYASDGLIAWNRFVRPLGRAVLAVMVTYHAGQVALVLALLG